MLALLAALPILAVLALMLGLGWSAARAGTLAAAGTLVLAVLGFGFGGAADPFGVPAGVVGVLAEAGFVALTVIAIIGPALGIHYLQQYTGATDRLRAGLARITPDPRVAALMIAWFFTLFLEGAAGFGTPVALAAPFLVAAGFRPVPAGDRGDGRPRGRGVVRSGGHPNPGAGIDHRPDRCVAVVGHRAVPRGARRHPGRGGGSGHQPGRPGRPATLGLGRGRGGAVLPAVRADRPVRRAGAANPGRRAGWGRSGSWP